jgi:hypothetical protein
VQKELYEATGGELLRDVSLRTLGSKGRRQHRTSLKKRVRTPELLSDNKQPSIQINITPQGLPQRKRICTDLEQSNEDEDHNNDTSEFSQLRELILSSDERAARNAQAVRKFQEGLFKRLEVQNTAALETQHALIELIRRKLYIDLALRHHVLE